MYVFRIGEAEDIDTIVEFNCRLALETEGKHLDRMIVQRGVSRALQLAPEVQYFVAEFEGCVVAQLMLTREWSDWRDGWMIWLQSVYVGADYRRAGVFRRLLEHAMQAAAVEGRIVSWRLYVDHVNEAAKLVYRRLGFVSSGYEVMELPTPAP